MRYFILFLFFFSLFATAEPLPIVKTKPGTAFSQLLEKPVGKQFMNAIRANYPLVYDPIVTQYVKHIGNRLLLASKQQPNQFYFFIIKSGLINAFAGPAGYVGIDTGLIKATANRSQLAAVMAHEIAHVLQHHLQRQSAESKRLLLPTIGAIAAGALVGGQAGTGLIAAGLASNKSETLRYSRSYEAEADRIGMKLLDKAGFNPYAMPNFFKKLLAQERLYDQMPAFLRSHPVTVERIADSLNRAANYSKKTYGSDPNYALIKMRVRIDTAKNSWAVLQYYQQKIKNHPDNVILHYGLALSLEKNNQYNKARQLLTMIKKVKPDNIIIRLSLAELAIHALKPKLALKWLRPLVHQHDNYHFATLYFQAQALALNHQYKQAIKLYQNLINIDKNNTRLYQACAQLQAKAGDAQAGYLTLANMYLQIGAKRLARQQINLGLKTKMTSPATRAALHLALINL